MDRISKIIRLHRIQNGLTQAELAKKLSVKRRFVSRWEAGISLPDAKALGKLADVLKINSVELLGGTVGEVRKVKKYLTVSIIVLIALVLLLGGIHVNDKLDTARKWLGLSARQADPFSSRVTMTQLIANLERYDGKVVHVVGYANLEFEGYAVWLSEEDFMRRTFAAIWLDFDSYQTIRRLEKYNGNYVLIEGVFDKDNTGHLPSSLFSV